MWISQSESLPTKSHNFFSTESITPSPGKNTNVAMPDWDCVITNLEIKSIRILEVSSEDKLLGYYTVVSAQLL